MRINEISKADWKLFHSKIADWQEAYMEKLVQQYIWLLSSKKPASDKFWELDERIKKDKKSPGVLLQLEKNSAYWDIAKLIRDGAITFDDLEEFSDDLKDAVSLILRK